MVRRALRRGGYPALTAVAPNVGVQAVRAHPWASVGVLSTPCGVDEHQAGIARAGGVEQVDQGVAPSGVVGGPLFVTAVVEVLVGALVEAPPHCCWPSVVIFRKGVVRPVVPVPGRRVCDRQAACAAVPQFGGTQCDNIPRGGLQLDLGRPGALDGVVEPVPQSSQGPGYAIDLVAPRRSCELRNGIVHLEAMEGVQSVSMEDWSDDYANSDH